jgi:murein L,D-transpeptidase YcbB/YkuD
MTAAQAAARQRMRARRPAPLALCCLLVAGAATAVEPLPPTGALQAADPDWHIPTPPDAGPPVHPDYARLAAALERYRAIAAAGGWRPLPAGEPLAVGARHPRVAELRTRLRAGGDYDSEMGADPWFFDYGMDRALRRVQRRHGLAEDGVLGERTLEALNIPVEALVGQIEASMERWRRLPRDPGPRHVWVNIARAQLDVVENGAPALSMRIVVGHRERPTPSLAGEISRVTFNPTWSVPRRIAVEDLLPRQQDDPAFLARNGIAVLAGSGDALRAADVDWARLDADRFPYRLVQAAGPGNSLGRIKIAFDNPYDIYLHDTPIKGLFAFATRTFSSGCVRLEDAQRLATLLLAQDRTWTDADTAAEIAASATRTLNLARRVPIYLVYMTVWSGEDGELRFGRDLYGSDARLAAALHAPAADLSAAPAGS